MKKRVSKVYQMPPIIHGSKRCTEKEHYKLNKCKDCQKEKACPIQKHMPDANVILHLILEQDKQPQAREVLQSCIEKHRGYTTIEILGEVSKKVLEELSTYDNDTEAAQFHAAYEQINMNYLKHFQIIVNEDTRITEVTTKLRNGGCQMGERDLRHIANAMLNGIDFITDEEKIKKDENTIKKVAKEMNLRKINIIRLDSYS